MAKIIKTAKVLLMLLPLLYSCHHSAEKHSNKQVLGQVNYYLIDSLSIEELDKLYGVTIATRGELKTPGKFEVVYKGQQYVLPINPIGLSIERADNFDVVSFARANGVDSINAIDFIVEYSSDIEAVFAKTGAYEIISHSKFGGEFIIFRMSADFELIYLREEAGLSHLEWKAFFKNESNHIRGNWYLRIRKE